MKQVAVVAALTLFIGMLFAGGTLAEDETTFSYIGATKCKMCHNSAKAGKQYTIWSESAHANAYNMLGMDKAKEVAKGMGIEDPQKSDKCLKCHAPSHFAKAELKGDKWDITEGVSCEDCHGPGSAYQKMSVMKALAAGTEKPETVGLLLPGEKKCLTCHNDESPTYDKEHPFKFDEMYKKIAHNIPEEKK